MPTEQISVLIKDWKLWPTLCSEQPNNDEFLPLVKGLTNSNYLYTPTRGKHANTTYVFRLNAQNAQSLGLNRHAEWHIHQCIAQYNICKPYVYRDPKDLYWVRPYLESQTLQESLSNGSEADTISLLKEAAKKLKIIHRIPLSTAWPKIDFKQRTDHYWQQILKQIDDHQLTETLSSFKKELDIQLKSPGYALRLCHMDPNPNNWIIGNTDLYLIDWEYAAIGNPAWDLAVFCDTCNLSESQKDSFLSFYGSGQIKMSQLQFADRQMKYISALWYSVQKITSAKELLPQLENLIRSN